MNGETVNLQRKTYRTLRIIIIIVTVVCTKILFPIISFGFIILQSVFMYIAYTKSDVNYNLPIYICWWFYYCFCAVQVTAVILGYSVMISILVLYLMLRFNQINEKFKLISQRKRISYTSMMKVISEFYSVA